ncbi:MAG: hypothetical protein WCE54_14395 [Ignavibacteriaceae bacterium]
MEKVDDVSLNNNAALIALKIIAVKIQLYIFNLMIPNQEKD